MTWRSDDYGLRPFVRAVADDIAGRCVKCYEIRLYEAARMAKEGGFDAFTSSLFISPYQQHELMRDVASLSVFGSVRNAALTDSGALKKLMSAAGGSAMALRMPVVHGDDRNMGE